MPAIQTLCRQHPSFPTSLRDIPSWPSELHCHGLLRQDGPAIAIVGARAATGRGMRRSRELACELAATGHRILSGGALGVDSAAHQGALAAGGYTLAVMACGLNQYYPRRNRALFEAMLAAGGAIVSPYGEGCDPIAGRFVRRNQVIAALADLVIVIEASTNSGSLHTARFAMALGRKLAVVSGSPGCEALLAAGIAGIESARDVADVLAGRAPVAAVRLPEDGSPPGRVLRALSQRQPVSAEQLQARLGIPLRVLQRVLLRLHLDSLVVALPGQRYLRSPLAARAMASRF